MKAISLTCRESFRFGPDVSNRNTTIRVDDGAFCLGAPNEPSFKRGTIDVYLGEGPEGSRYVKLCNPKADRLNGGEPLVTYIPMEAVSSWEPLREKQATALYPEAQRETWERRPEPKPRDAEMRGHAKPPVLG